MVPPLFRVVLGLIQGWSAKDFSTVRLVEGLSTVGAKFVCGWLQGYLGVFKSLFRVGSRFASSWLKALKFTCSRGWLQIYCRLGLGLN